MFSGLNALAVLLAIVICGISPLRALPINLSSWGGATAINLLPDGAVTLVPDNFDGDDGDCGNKTVVRGEYDGFALPAPSPPTLSILLALTGASCQGTGWQQAGVLLGLQGLDLLLDCKSRAIVLSSPSSPSASLTYPLPPGLAPPADLTLVVTRDQGATNTLGVCINGQQVAQASLTQSSAASLTQSSAAFLAALESSRSLFSSGVFLGARPGSRPSANATLNQLWLMNAVLPCSARKSGPPVARPSQLPAFSTLSPLSDGGVSLRLATGEAQQSTEALEWDLAALEAGNSAPLVIGWEQVPAGDIFVDDDVSVSMVATDADGDALRMTLTFYGLPPLNCTAEQCGDLREEAVVSTAHGPAKLTAAVSYPRPGRYIVRAQVSDMRGTLVWSDHAILVRKQGDTEKRAPCCRHTSFVVAQAAGRPIHHTQFRPPSLQRLASALGWSQEYMQGPDLEAERLFDFGMLAPALPPSPLRLLTCHDTRLAGAGSPAVYGSRDRTRSETRGHAKKLAIVPVAFPWADASQVGCQRHWSGWERGSPYRVNSRSGLPCSVGCSKEGTEMFISSTGAFDQYNQALIQSSYGELSLNPDVAVLPEVHVPFNLPGTDVFSYYETPAVQALSQARVPYWMYWVLSPLANHRVPPFKAWSAGMGPKNAIMTQCYPTMYYSLHETGHRLGFRHANVYRLQDATSAPTNPLGPGTLTTQGYSVPLDGMSGGRGDFGLYNRIMAGWVGGTQRSMLSMQDVAQHGEHTVELWPFDRSESRGKLMALTIRMSPSQLLVVGYRSTPHWQDVRVAPNGGSGRLAEEEMRANVAGISVEVLRRDPASGAWSESGLLDFNALHGDWPHALPTERDTFPRGASFALLKEGRSWYDPPSRLLLLFERAATCRGQPGLPLYSYAAQDFYGFRGELAGAEFPERADYTGYATLQCARLVVKTQAPAPSGKLRFAVEMEEIGGGDVSLPFTADVYESSGSDYGDGVAPSRRRLQQSGSHGGSEEGSSGLQMSLRFSPEDSDSLVSVVWRDARNRTFASGDNMTAAELPAMSAVIAESATNPLFVCVQSCPNPRTYYVHALAADGRHTEARITLSDTNGGTEANIGYTYYQLEELSFQQQSLFWESGSTAVFESGDGGRGGGPGVVLIAAGAGGGVAALAMAAIVAWLCLRRQRKTRVLGAVVAPGVTASDVKESLERSSCLSAGKLSQLEEVDDKLEVAHRGWASTM